MPSAPRDAVTVNKWRLGEDGAASAVALDADVAEVDAAPGEDRPHTPPVEACVVIPHNCAPCY